MPLIPIAWLLVIYLCSLLKTNSIKQYILFSLSSTTMMMMFPPMSPTASFGPTTTMAVGLGKELQSLKSCLWVDCFFWVEKVTHHFHHLHATQPTWATKVTCQLQSTQNGCSCLSDPFSFFSPIHYIPAHQYSYLPSTPAFSLPLCPMTTIPCILLKEYKH